VNGKRQYLIFGLRLAFGLGMLIAAFQIVDFRSVHTAIGSLDPFTFVLALLVSAIGTIVVPAIITSRTLKVGDIRIGLWDLVKINFAMRLYVLTLPHAITVGMRWHRYCGSQQGKGWQVAALLVFERIAQFIAVVSLALVFLLASYSNLPGPFRVLIPVSGFFTVFGVILFLIFVSRDAFSLAKPAINFAVKRTPRLISGRIERLAMAITDYQKIGNRNVVFVLTWSLVWHGLFVLSAFIVSQGLGIDVGFADIGWMRSAVFLLTVLPITVGGIGVREVGFAVLLHFYGVNAFLALAFPLVLLTIQLLLGLVGATLEAARITSGLWNHINARD
jgi:uncharacterized membrane protein YbhN (UPF0104 family)